MYPQLSQRKGSTSCNPFAENMISTRSQKVRATPSPKLVEIELVLLRHTSACLQPTSPPPFISSPVSLLHVLPSHHTLQITHSGISEASFFFIPAVNFLHRYSNKLLSCFTCACLLRFCDKFKCTGVAHVQEVAVQTRLDWTRYLLPSWM